ncbi:FAD-dependent oxidoreductase [Sphingomonas jatrophae]|uniref:Choline dehydrogenase n=1 Tax=Sphingomonas jatrophae TaxID=1166337 RepID=A0A1I6KZW4_9SPHN|nr:GMC family oxidoreductase [Sphingomonas jatrophae]SFR96734.1 Choline dehydrogenase [Sphingomonas jatrophae]
MHIDLNEIAPVRLRADVAVIGAGAAGITATRRLLSHGLSVILLESGGLDYERDTAALNDGDVVGEPYYDLEDARLRFFGGTTAIWGGRCAELDPIDFERRSWIPHSGWPIAYDEVRPYYAEASQALGLAPGLRTPPPLAFDDSEIATPRWLFDEQFDRFAFTRCRDVVEHPRCTILTHATVREIVAAPSGRGITRLAVVNHNGRSVDVQAADYVLAAGGIENPRLLLASRSLMQAGLGNDRDLVGRFFMEHPHARGGRIVGKAAWQWLSAFGFKRAADGSSYAHLIAPSPALQRREGLLNTSLTIAGRRPAMGKEALLMRAYLHAKHSAAPTRSGRALWKATKKTVRRVQSLSEPLRPWLLHKTGQLDVALVVRAEQSPNPDSRIRLSNDKDALGMPRVQLDWRLNELDVRSVAGLVGALGREAERLALGTVEAAEWLSRPEAGWQTDPLISAHPIGGFHHLGTTRMADDPAQGVVDRDGRVHGIGNLHVVGSSTFPTGGWANPTLTIVALAMRTADRLAACRSSAATIRAQAANASAKGAMDEAEHVKLRRVSRG